MKVFTAKEAAPPPSDRMFPMIIGHKSATVKVYEVPNRKQPSYTVAYHSEGTRRRVTRRDFDTAFKFAQAIALKLGGGTSDVLVLHGIERHIYERSTNQASALGIELDVLVNQFSEASKLAGGPEHLLEAARIYHSQHGRAIQPKMVREVVKELIEHRRSNGKSGLYLRDLRVRLEGQFAGAFKMNISMITRADIERFLDTVKGSPRTKLNFVTSINTLLQFAKNRGYLPDNYPAISSAEYRSEATGNIEIFSVEEMRTLLAFAKPMLIPTIAICAFAGLRSEEAKRLDWSQVNFGEKFIEVTAKNAKTKTRRIVPITDNLRRWLLPHRQTSGLVFPHSNLALQFGKLARSSGIKWKKNALRHSFISYRVAQVENVARVALEAGNSPGVIQSCYLRMVTKAKGRQWFSIRPSQSHNVITLTTPTRRIR